MKIIEFHTFRCWLNINISGEIRDVFAHGQNFPYPFNSSTAIRFRLPGVGNVSLKIYNSVGEQVKTLVDKNMDKGFHHVTWDATGNNATNCQMKFTFSG